MKQRSDGRWVKKITLPNGIRKYFYSSADTEKKANKDIEKQLLEYTQSEEKGRLFSDVANEWEKEHCKNLSYATCQRYKTYVSTAKNFLGGKYIKDITPQNIELFLSDMASKNYSSKTIKDQASVVKMIFKYSMIKGYVTNDVSFYITPPKGVKSVKREALTENEIDIVNNSIECTFGFLAYFLLYTGLRKGEALALQWKDIDFKNDIIRIYKSVYYESNTPHIKDTKTEAGNRNVVLLKCLKEKLVPQDPESYIFNNKGNILNKSFFTRQWEKYKLETGLKISAHQLRHTFVTILYEAGVDEKMSQTILGHSDITTTRNIYTHIREHKLTSVTNQINNFLSEAR